MSISIGNKLLLEPGIASIDFCGVKGIELGIKGIDLGYLVLVVKHIEVLNNIEQYRGVRGIELSISCTKFRNILLTHIL